MTLPPERSAGMQDPCPSASPSSGRQAGPGRPGAGADEVPQVAGGRGDRWRAGQRVPGQRGQQRLGRLAERRVIVAGLRARARSGLVNLRSGSASRHASAWASRAATAARRSLAAKVPPAGRSGACTAGSASAVRPLVCARVLAPAERSSAVGGAVAARTVGRMSNVVRRHAEPVPWPRAEPVAVPQGDADMTVNARGVLGSLDVTTGHARVRAWSAWRRAC
jgi:hypothetical protein